MKKNLALKAMLVGCASFALLGGALAINDETTASANNTQVTLTEPTTFAMVEGAQVRKTVGSSGIRFSTLINDEWLDTTLAGEEVEYGYLVAENLADGVELTEDNGAKVKADVLLSVDTNGDDVTDFYRYNFSITNVPQDKYETKVSARAYVTINGETTYGDTQTRSLAVVASRAYAAGEADPDSVIAGYVNKVAENGSVSFAAETQKLNKAVITTETAGLAVTTQPAGYAVKLTSSDDSVAKIVNGKIVPQAKEGKATITAKFGDNVSDTYELTVVSYSATLGDKAIADDTKVTVNVADGYFASITNPYGASSVATQASNATEVLVVKEYDGTNYTDVTDTAVDYAYSVAGVAEVQDGTIAGGTVNGTTTVSATVDGYEVANFDVEGWTEITTIAQMNELSLVTWRQRNSEATVEAVLGGKYKLGADLAYNGAYILPIANLNGSVSNSLGTDVNNDGTVNSSDNTLAYLGGSAYYSAHSWLWKDILNVIEPVADGEEAGTWKEWWGKSTSSKGSWTSTEYDNAFLRSINPLGVSFTGVFDGNGHTISDAQILDVNFLYTQFSNQSDCINTSAAGGCFIGLLGQGGVLKNVEFKELRWRKYYGKTSAERETTLSSTDPDYADMQVYIDAGHNTTTGQILPYYDSITTTSLSALVVVNRGLMSDIRMSSYYKSAAARYTNVGMNANNKNHAFGAMVNDSTGVINNMVVELLAGEIKYLRNTTDFVEGETTNWDSALNSSNTSGGNSVFYARNYGTVQNSIFLSNVTSGRSVRKSLTSTSTSYHDFTLIYGYGNAALDEYKGIKINAGTVTNCAGYFEDWSNATTILDIFAAGTAAGNTTYPGTHVNLDSYSTDLWDLETLKFKQQ